MRCPNQAKLKVWRHARGAREKGHVIFLKIGETHEEQVSRVPHSAIFFLLWVVTRGSPFTPTWHRHEKEKLKDAPPPPMSSSMCSHVPLGLSKIPKPLFFLPKLPLSTLNFTAPVTFFKKKLKEKQMYGFSNRNATWQRLYFKDFIRH